PRCCCAGTNAWHSVGTGLIVPDRCPPTPTVPADAGVMDARTGEHVTSVYRIAAADPGRVAVIEASGRQVSYGQLVDVIHGYARGLQALGLGAGDGIVLLAPNTIGFRRV